MELPLDMHNGWGGARPGAGRKPKDGRGGARAGAGRPRGRKTTPERRKLEPPGELKMPTPKVVDFRPIALRARDHTGLALAALVSCLRDPNAPWPAVIAAANAILDRGWGRPTEKVANLNLNPLAGLTDEALQELLDALRTAEPKDEGAEESSILE